MSDTGNIYDLWLLLSEPTIVKCSIFPLDVISGVPSHNEESTRDFSLVTGRAWMDSPHDTLSIVVAAGLDNVPSGTTAPKEHQTSI